jgi:hypothetical protein
VDFQVAIPEAYKKIPYKGERYFVEIDEDAAIVSRFDRYMQ